MCTPEPGARPNPAGSCSEMQRFFEDRLGLDAKGIAALMGVRTLGGAFAENSGYDGRWMDAVYARKFNNKYFNDMLVYGWAPQKSKGGKMQWVRADVAAPFESNAIMQDTELCLAYTSDNGKDLHAGEDDCCAWSHSSAV